MVWPKRWIGAMVWRIIPTQPSSILVFQSIRMGYSFKIKSFSLPFWSLIQSCIIMSAPRVAPTNVTAYNTSSTSLHVTWQPINTEGLRGILREYRVYFIEQKTYFIQSLRNVTVDSSTLEVDLVGLYKFTNYSVYIVARTNKDGVSSVKVNVSTDEDSKWQRATENCCILQNVSHFNYLSVDFAWKRCSMVFFLFAIFFLPSSEPQGSLSRLWKARPLELYQPRECSQ